MKGLEAIAKLSVHQMDTLIGWLEDGMSYTAATKKCWDEFGDIAKAIRRSTVVRFHHRHLMNKCLFERFDAHELSSELLRFEATGVPDFSKAALKIIEQRFFDLTLTHKTDDETKQLALYNSILTANRNVVTRERSVAVQETKCDLRREELELKRLTLELKAKIAGFDLVDPRKAPAEGEPAENQPNSERHAEPSSSWQPSASPSPEPPPSPAEPFASDCEISEDSPEFPSDDNTGFLMPPLPPDVTERVFKAFGVPEADRPAIRARIARDIAKAEAEEAAQAALQCGRDSAALDHPSAPQTPSIATHSPQPESHRRHHHEPL